jgi:hypothetical protein
MRSLWLASAALIVTTGMAFAQTSTPGMAPAGAPNAPVETSPGMSPGKTAPPSGMSNQGMSNQGTSSGMQSPPANGSGSSAMGNGSMGNGSTGTGMTPHHAHHEHMAANGSTKMYLHMAQEAIRQHNRTQADEALSHAETRMLTRAVPQSTAATADSSPGVTAIENARAAVRKGNWAEAAQDTQMAMQHHANEGTGNEGMGGGSMGNGSMGNGSMGNGSTGNTPMGSGAMSPAPSGTSGKGSAQ